MHDPSGFGFGVGGGRTTPFGLTKDEGLPRSDHMVGPRRSHNLSVLPCLFPIIPSSSYLHIQIQIFPIAEEVPLLSGISYAYKKHKIAV